MSDTPIRQSVTPIALEADDSRLLGARSLVWHGALLIVLGLLSGFTTLFAPAPRAALGAHTIGVLQGAVLLGMAGAWPLLVASPRMLGGIKTTLLVAFYANWSGAQLGALWSAARHTYIPQHAANMPAGAPPWMDGVVTALFAVSMLALVSGVLLLCASRRVGQRVDATGRSFSQVHEHGI